MSGVRAGNHSTDRAVQEVNAPGTLGRRWNTDMSREMSDVLNAVTERLLVLAAEDERLRLELQALAKHMLRVLDRPVERAKPEPREEAIEAAPAAPVVPAPSADADGKQAPEDGQAASPTQDTAFRPAPAAIKGPTPSPRDPEPQLGDNERLVDWRAYSAAEDAELPLIERRARLKAEASRWQATREQLIGDGADYVSEIVPQDQDIIERAKALPDCFLWMCRPSESTPPDSYLWEDLAGCFDALASAAAFTHQAIDDFDREPAAMERALDLLAEAQSAVRMGVVSVGYGWDPDQKKVYNWLRRIGREYQVYIQRYMRVDDPADPTAWGDLHERIEAADADFQQTRRTEKERQNRFNRIRYHLKLIRDERGGDHDWQRIAETCDEMVAHGVPPSSRELRNLLLPVVDQIPDLGEPPEGFRLVLRELDHYLASRPTAPQTSTAAAEPTEEVRRAAQLLGGRSLLLIGGEARPGAQQALEKAFDLKQCIWLEAKEHQSLSTFEPHVANPDVELVVLAIRWSSHSFGDVKQYCDQYGKPLVRLPAGYNPNQVALQIVQQCSEQLQSGA